MNDERLFYQPTQAELEAGLACDGPDCSGQYAPKKRDLVLTVGGNRVTIQDTEYWECEECGAFVTAREESRRIRKEARQQAEYSGRLVVRMDPSMHRQLTELAEANHRSLNGEILYRLKQSLGSDS